jgi:tetratricopeptide (TPR) repeat protein
MTQKELSSAVYDAVRALCAEGDELAEGEMYGEAIDIYRKAFSLLPGDPRQWEAATWILAAIGDAEFLGGRAEAAVAVLDHAFECPNSLGNGFLHLRRGQALFDLGRRSEAANELTRAYMAEGEEIFRDEDPEYLRYLKTVLRPSAK